MITLSKNQLRLAIQGLIAFMLFTILLLIVKFRQAETYLLGVGFTLSCQECNLFHPVGCQRTLRVQEGTAELNVDGRRFAGAAAYLNVGTMRLGNEHPISISNELFTHMHIIPLHTLDFSGTYCDDSDLQTLRGMPSLRNLTLGATYPSGDKGRNRIRFKPSRITDDGLAAIIRHRSVETLNLRDLEITDKGIQSIAGMSIRNWNVSGTLVTDDTSKLLADNKYLSRIVFSETVPSLLVSSCDPRSFSSTMVSVAGYGLLQKRRPGVHIEYPVLAMTVVPPLPVIQDGVITRTAFDDAIDELSPSERISLDSVLRDAMWKKVTGQLARSHDKPFIEVLEGMNAWRMYRYNEKLLVLAWNNCYWAARIGAEGVPTVDHVFGETH